ncbi:MAG: META domain-containing protein [Chloroflexi bacterium]|nr:META domain-containing protein [Chloroflexota bacterium]
MITRQKNRKIWLGVAGILISLVLAACGPVSGPAPAPDIGPLHEPAINDSEAGDLDGKLWVLESYLNGDGEIVPIFPGTRPTAEFEEGGIAGSTGCNQYSGSYETSGNNIAIEIGPVTMRACPEQVSAQETDYLAALANAATYEISGEQLQMADADGQVVLTYRVDHPVPLVNTDWQLLSYNNGKGGLVSSLNTESITALFDDEGALSGFSGCNNYTGAYEADETNIEIGPVASTEKMCADPQGVMEDETGYLAALSMVSTYEIQGEELTMYNDEGSRVLVYRVSMASATAATDEPAAASAPATDQLDANAVMVQSVAIEARDGQDIAVVQGENSDACPRAYVSEQTVDGAAITIEMLSIKPVDVMCAQMITPFTEEIVIDASGLEPGDYSVTVNGVEANEVLVVAEVSAAAS